MNQSQQKPGWQTRILEQKMTAALQMSEIYLTIKQNMLMKFSPVDRMVLNRLSMTAVKHRVALRVAIPAASAKLKHCFKRCDALKL